MSVTRAQDAEDTRVDVVRRLGVLDTPREERFERVVRLAQSLFGVEKVAVALVDRDRVFHKAGVGIDTREHPREASLSAIAIEHPDLLVIEDARADPRFRDNPYVTGPMGVRFFAGQPLHGQAGYRVGTLCLADSTPRTFGEEDARLLRDLALWVEKELLVHEDLERASQVQAGLLPRTMPHLPGYEVSGRCLPARAVGGDFYDWHPVTSGVALTLADVMGKGGGAAIIAATVRAVLRSSARRGDVAASLADAEAALEADLLRTGSFVTAFHGKIDPDAHVLTWTDAGHGLTLLLRADGTSERLASQGPPLGAVPGTERVAAQVALEPGDLVLTLSDGVLDALDTPGGTLEALAVVERAVRGAASAHEAVAQVLWALGANDRPDDLTILALRRDAVG
ncbi:PP2C family protein-serine/threonine phosphatase [Cellulomonas sp. NPDC055163]